MPGEKVEFCADRASYGGRNARAQDFLHGPERLGLVGRLHHENPGRIETETVETMSMQSTIADSNEHHRGAARQAAEQGGDEAEGGGLVRFGLRDDFMHSSERQAALRQAGIEDWQSKRQDRL